VSCFEGLFCSLSRAFDEWFGLQGVCGVVVRCGGGNGCVDVAGWSDVVVKRF